jgi:methionyl-tRNA formyltransferase
MLLRGMVPITDRMTTPDLHDALSALGARLIVQALADMPPAVPQPDEGATYAAKLSRGDGRIDWRRDAAVLDRQVRALNPWPGTFSQLGPEMIKILAAHPVAGSGAAGAILDADLTVACGAGALRLDRVQRPGRPAMSGGELLRGITDGLRQIFS